MGEQITRHMHKAILLCKSDDFTHASAALAIAVHGADLFPITISVYGKQHTVTITDAGTWKVVEQ